MIRDGSIKLYSETIDGRIDVIPYMDNTVEGWILDKNFSLNCREDLILISEILITRVRPLSYLKIPSTPTCVVTLTDADNNNRDLDLTMTTASTSGRQDF